MLYVFSFFATNSYVSPLHPPNNSPPPHYSTIFPTSALYIVNNFPHSEKTLPLGQGQCLTGRSLPPQELLSFLDQVLPQASMYTHEATEIHNFREGGHIGLVDILCGLCVVADFLVGRLSPLHPLIQHGQILGLGRIKPYIGVRFPLFIRFQV